jgi:hypothetical protein
LIDESKKKHDDLQMIHESIKYSVNHLSVEYAGFTLFFLVFLGMLECVSKSRDD